MVYVRGASTRNGAYGPNNTDRDQDRFQRKIKFILIIIGAFAIAAYLVAIPGEEGDDNGSTKTLRGKSVRTPLAEQQQQGQYGPNNGSMNNNNNNNNMMNNVEPGPDGQAHQPAQYEAPSQPQSYDQQQQQPEHAYPEMENADTGSQKVYPAMQHEEEQHEKGVESPGEITEALTNAVLDMEMAEEVQLEEKEEKLFNTKIVEVEQQMRTDISNAVHNIMTDTGNGQNDQLVEDEIKTIQDEATYTLEEKALKKLESKVNEIVDEAELEVEEIITEDEEEGMDTKDIVKDIETMELIAEKDIEQETDAVEKEIENSLDSLSKQVEKEVIKKKLGVDVTDSDFEDKKVKVNVNDDYVKEAETTKSSDSNNDNNKDKDDVEDSAKEEKHEDAQEKLENGNEKKIKNDNSNYHTKEKKDDNNKKIEYKTKNEVNNNEKNNKSQGDNEDNKISNKAENNHEKNKNHNDESEKENNKENKVSNDDNAKSSSSKKIKDSDEKEDGDGNDQNSKDGENDNFV